MDNNGTGFNPLLEESKIAERKDKFLILGSRREGGQMGVVAFANTLIEADAGAKALVTTGWATVEVYTRASVHTRGK